MISNQILQNTIEGLKVELPEPLYAQDSTVFLQEPPSALLSPLRAVQAPLQDWLEANPDAEVHAQLLELYFAVQDIARAAERYDSHFVTQLTARGRELELQLLCLDPAPFVDASLAAGRSAALFSATLAPPSFYRSVLGCSDARAVALDSPFRLKIWGCIACRISLPATATAKPACRQFRMHWPSWCRPERETTLPFSQATHICGRYTKILQHVTRAFAPLCRKAVWMMPLGLNFWLSLCRTRPKHFWVLA